MVFIQIEIGSRAKGYSCVNSDYDRLIFTKCNVNKFLEYIEKHNVLSNQHLKTIDGDCGYVDLYKGLMGIYTGKYYYLGVFAKQEDVLNMDGTPNYQLFNFIRYLTRLRMRNILETMLQYKVHDSKWFCPKSQLMLMFNLAYVERWLTTNEFPDEVKLPDLLLEDNHKGRNVYYSLMNARKRGKVVSETEENYLNNWRDELRLKLQNLPPLEECYGIRKTIVMYMLDEGYL